MNAIELLAYLVNIFVSCHALPITEQVIGGTNFQVQSWVCQAEAGPMTVKAWRRPCDTGHTKYWGRLVYLEFQELHISAYLDKFGGVNIGQGGSIQDSYLPSCEA